MILGGGLVAKSCVTLGTPWTVAHQAPMSIGFLRQEYQSGLPFTSPADLLTQGLNPGLLQCRQSFALQADSLRTESSGKPLPWSFSSYQQYLGGGKREKAS